MGTTIIDGSIPGPVFDVDSGALIGIVTPTATPGIGVMDDWGAHDWPYTTTDSYHIYRNLSRLKTDAPIWLGSPNVRIDIEGIDGLTEITEITAGLFEGFWLDNHGVELNVSNCFIHGAHSAAPADAVIFAGNRLTGGTLDVDDIMVRFYNCLFNDNLSHEILWKVGNRCKAFFSHCQWERCAAAIETNPHFVEVEGAVTTEIPEIYFRNCTIFHKTNDTTADVITLYVIGNAILEAQDCIITQQNVNGGFGSKVGQLDSSANGARITSLGGNWLYTYVEAHVPGDFTPISTDQSGTDPSFTDDGCPILDLHPDGSVGSPELWQASTIAWHPGRLEPFNLETVSAPVVAAAGSTAVWAERKQRIYDGNLGTEDNKHIRGRGLRIRTRSRDVASQKLVAGIWVKHTPERTVK
jgi:hypothetical protein